MPLLGVVYHVVAGLGTRRAVEAHLGDADRVRGLRNLGEEDGPIQLVHPAVELMERILFDGISPSHGGVLCHLARIALGVLVLRL